MSDEQKTKICPCCGETVLAAAKKCKHCGEWIDKENQQEEPQAIHCPVCGEEILNTNTKCPHCGEAVNIHTSNLSKINSLKVCASWKRRFEVIDKVYENGICWKSNKNADKEEAKSAYNNIMFKNGGIGTFIAAYLLGCFYYLFKGMWLKAIVYTLILLLIAIILCTLIPSLEEAPGAPLASLNFIWVALAPFDYYRCKVLGKQW